MKSLNELQGKGLPPNPPPLNSLPPPTAAHPRNPEDEARTLPNLETEFLSSDPTVQPADQFFQGPTHLPTFPEADSAPADESVVPLGSQAGSWIAEKAAETGEENRMLFVGQDAFALELDPNSGQIPPEAQGAEAVAEDQIEAAPVLSPDAAAEQPPPDAQSQVQTSAAEPPAPAGLDWVPVAATDAGDEAGVAATMGDTPEAAAAENETGFTEFPTAPVAEPTPALAENQAGTDEHLHVLEGECAQLRQAVANHEKECEMLVNRMLTSESELHDAQTQLSQRDDTIANLQQQLDAVKEQQPSAGPAGAEATPPDQEAAPDLEQQLSHNVAALARVTADLARERGERQRSEERAAALNRKLQELHTETIRLLESQRADQHRIGELDGQLRQRDEDLTRLTADLEQHKADCELADEQLRKTKELNAQLQKDHSFFEAAHQSVNSTQKDLQSRLATWQESAAKLQRETAERQRLQAALDEAQRGLQTERQNRETLESELQRASQTLREAQAKLQQESTERQRFKEALDSTDLELGDRCQRAELEVGQLRSALQLEQVERQRLESELVRVRQMTLDAARGTRLLRNTLRKQVREPVDNLYRSTQSLLQLDLGKDQKQIAETILQDVLLVHTRLQEPAVVPGDTGNVAPNPDQSASEQNAVPGTPSPASATRV